MWIKEGPGIAQIVAEWMTYGYPHLCDPHSTDITRFYPHEKTEHHILARCAEHFNKTYGIVHPREQWASQRGMRRSPFYAREEALGAVFFDARGWERPQWYESNAEPGREVPRRRRKPRQHEWDAAGGRRSPTPSTWRCARASAWSTSPRSTSSTSPDPGAKDYLQYMCVNNVDVAVGRSVYTPLLTPHGGFRGDLTIQRLGDDHFRIITGAFDGGRDNYWFNKHLPTDGSVTFTDRSHGICTLGVWGPNAEKTLAKIVTDQSKPYDVSQAGFPYGAVREVLIDGMPCIMFRISYVGENGWEIYTNMEHGLRLWDTVAEAGKEFDIIPVGIGVYAVTGRIEKGYRLMGAELESEYNPVEAGLARPKVKSADFIGKEAYLKAREEAPAAIMCTLSMDSQQSRRRHRPLPDRWQRADPHARRRAHRRRQGPRLASHHRRCRTVGRQVPAAGLPPAGARRRGHQAAGDVHERAVPGRPSSGPARRRCSIPTTPE